MLKGFFDLGNKWLVHGWAVDDAKRTPLALEVYVNEKFDGETVANGDFPHLKKISSVLGPCGFIYKVTEKHLQAGLNVIKVVSKAHKDYVCYAKSPTMNHLPVILADKDFLDIRQYQRLHRELGALMRQKPELLASLTQYAEDRIELAPRELDVLFVNGLPEAMSSHYRVFAVAELLSRHHYSCFSITEASIVKARNYFSKIGTIVFFRTPYSVAAADMHNHFDALGTKVMFDIDDLIFKEEIVSSIDGYRRLNKDEKRQYLFGVRAYRNMLSLTRRATASTQPLLAHMKDFVVEGAVVPNMLTEAALNVCSEVFATRQNAESTREQFTIGYYSGTATHQSDFHSIVRPLIRILVEHPIVKLRLVGKLSLDEFPELASFSSRIEKVGIMPYLDMLKDYSNVDAVVAPLELGNEFNDSKSELKFFEAAAAGVVVITSATKPFLQVSDSGKNCLVCRTDEDWLFALRKIVRDRNFRVRMASAARAYALENFSTMSCNIDIAGIYRRAQDCNPRTINYRAQKKSKILFLVPGVFAGSGGLRKIFTLARYMVKAVNVSVDIFSTDAQATDLAYEVESHYFETGAQFLEQTPALAEYAAVVCTHWTTARFARENGAVASKTVYFIQDYEPYFEAAGTNFLEAMATYKFGFQHIYFGPWVGKYIKHHLGIEGIEVQFPIDKAVYYTNKSGLKVQSELLKILLYAKPSQPRRAFELAVRSLRLLRSSGVDFELYTYGDHLPQDSFGFPFTNLGPVNNPEELGALYRKCDLGVSFSSTNPSLVGYEMLACGLPIVDLAIPLAERNYAGIRGAALVNPDPDSICQEVLRHIQDARYHSQTVQDAVKNGPNLCITEDEFGDRFRLAIKPLIDNVSIGRKKKPPKDEENSLPVVSHGPLKRMPRKSNVR